MYDGRRTMSIGVGMTSQATSEEIAHATRNEIELHAPLQDPSRSGRHTPAAGGNRAPQHPSPGGPRGALSGAARDDPRSRVTAALASAAPGDPVPSASEASRSGGGNDLEDLRARR